MDFFGIGGGELIVILIVALLVWGPNRVVEIGRTLGKTVNSFKKAASDLNSKIDKELEEQKKEPPTANPQQKSGG
jgi:sec-independent protein translocase protein TatA